MEIPNNAEQGVINYVPQEQIRYNQTTKRKPQLIITFPNQDENENERVEIYQITKKSTALNMQGRYNIYWNCANRACRGRLTSERADPDVNADVHAQRTGKRYALLYLHIT